MIDDPPQLKPPLIRPLGDRALLVRFSATLSDAANRATITFARALGQRLPEGVEEIDPNLVSVLLRYDPAATSYEKLAGEIRLLLGVERGDPVPGAQHRIAVRFGGDAGPDLEEVAGALGVSTADFIAQHNAAPLRLLTTGFAPGFVYCGFHAAALEVPRRREVRRSVPAGTILFAARQTAITATAIPTGWHVIGRTPFRNFDASAEPPTRLREGDSIWFEAVT